MRTILVLTRPNALKSISQYGTQNKEAKNQKNNEYLATKARKNDFMAALEDVYQRDSQASSVEIRSLGSSQPIQHCSRCKETGHRATNCEKTASNQKFVDLSSMDPVYRVKNHEVDDGDDSSGEDQFDLELEDVNSNFRPSSSVSTPRGRHVRFDENLNDSPAQNTRSKTKAQASPEVVPSDKTADTGARRQLKM